MTASAAEPDRPADGRFTVQRSEDIFRGSIFSVRVDTVTMPGGGAVSREVVDHLRAVAVVALDDAGQVILIEQYRHPLRSRVWEIPAGLMDIADEPPLLCAQRELAEEVGLAADTWSLLVDLATSPGFTTEAIRVYLATGLRAVDAPERRDEEADMRTVRVPLDHAVMAVMDGRIVNASAVTGLLAADRSLRNGDTADEPRIVLRSADDPWTDSPALVNRTGGIGRAPRLGTGE